MNIVDITNCLNPRRTMNKRIFSAAFVSLALMMTGSDSHAFGNACRRVNFKVNNNFGDEITVEKFELYSASEGRYLNENFPDAVVFEGAQNFLVRRDETVEYAENDNITSIRVTFTYWTNTIPSQFRRTTRTDYSAGGVCVADRSYTATINP